MPSGAMAAVKQWVRLVLVTRAPDAQADLYHAYRKCKYFRQTLCFSSFFYLFWGSSGIS